METQALALDKLKSEAAAVINSYNCLRTQFLDMDYAAFDDGIHFHIFPRVPDYTNFLPDGQRFCSAVEAVVRARFGDVDVEAEFHEARALVSKAGVNGVIEVEEDTRVMTYFRDDSGRLTDIQYPKPVEKLWFVIRPRPGAIFGDNCIHDLARALADETTTLAKLPR